MQSTTGSRKVCCESRTRLSSITGSMTVRLSRRRKLPEYRKRRHNSIILGIFLTLTFFLPIPIERSASIFASLSENEKEPEQFRLLTRKRFPEIAVAKDKVHTFRSLSKNGAGGRTRTDTVSLPRDFKSLVSAIPPHPQQS